MRISKRWVFLTPSGKIQRETPCPFMHRCHILLVNKCHHKGEKHPCDFSCSHARAFDIGLQYKAVRDKNAVPLGRCINCGLLLCTKDNAALYPGGKLKCPECAKTPTDEYPVIE